MKKQFVPAVTMNEHMETLRKAEDGYIYVPRAVIDKTGRVSKTITSGSNPSPRHTPPMARGTNSSSFKAQYNSSDRMSPYNKRGKLVRPHKVLVDVKEGKKAVIYKNAAGKTNLGLQKKILYLPQFGNMIHINKTDVSLETAQ